MLQWPNDFTNPTPIIDFGNDLSKFFKHVIALGVKVTASEN